MLKLQDPRKRPDAPKDEIGEEEEEEKLREESGLTRTGRLFGGLINDVKRKAPWFVYLLLRKSSLAYLSFSFLAE